MYIVTYNGQLVTANDWGELCQKWFNNRWPPADLALVLKEEAREDRSEWVPPPFYWPAQKGLIKVSDMHEGHINAVLRSFEGRPESRELKYWTYIFQNELRKRHA